MQKIKLPIEETKEDKVIPSKPDFSWAGKMILYSLAFVFITFSFFYAFSYFIVSKISIEKEKEIFWDFFIEENMKKFDLSLLKTKIEKFKDYNIYINDSNEVNAFATPWANILINKWLLEQVESEEELIFIIAHEIWHIENRHIIKRFSMQIPFTMSLNFLWIDLWIWTIKAEDLIWNYFSRQDEKEADLSWIKALNKASLNLKCATRFFEKLEKERKIKLPQILSTHPNDENRIKDILKENKNSEKKCREWKWKEGE